jgi:6-phosphogluconolactonase
MPRNFNLTSDGKYLLAAHQESHEIVVFERNAETGELANTGISIQGHKPVYLHPIQ